MIGFIWFMTFLRLKAFFRARRVIHNALIDLRFGAPLTGSVRTRFASLGAKSTANSDYSGLSRIFEGRISDADVLVDVGCGKGRVINYWLSLGLRNKMIGIELDADIAARTRRRLRKFENVAIVTGDAVDSIPEDGTLFYLYNPFQAPVVAAFNERLKQVFGKRATITLIYYNCRHVDIFENDPAWRVEVIDINREPGVRRFDQLAVIKLSASN